MPSGYLYEIKSLVDFIKNKRFQIGNPFHIEAVHAYDYFILGYYLMFENSIPVIDKNNKKTSQLNLFNFS